jgi:hypothetical protein
MGVQPGQTLPSEQLYGPTTEMTPNTASGTQSQSQQLTPQLT